MAQHTAPSSRAVLVVEDEPLLLMDAMDMIEHAGLVVHGVCDADAAVALLEKRADIAVLFTDIDMPGSMDGLALAHLVAERWPAISIVVTSGHVRATVAELPANGTFFAKPYPPRDVVATLKSFAERS